MTVLAIAPALPLGSAGTYVAAAYVVFVALILTYVAIMAVRAQRLERDLEELRRDVEAARAQDDTSAPDMVSAGAARSEPSPT
jgi:hypothetical protein